MISNLKSIKPDLEVSRRAVSFAPELEDIWLSDSADEIPEVCVSIARQGLSSRILVDGYVFDSIVAEHVAEAVANIFRRDYVEIPSRSKKWTTMYLIVHGVKYSAMRSQPTDVEGF